jgi:hypothetical protein
MLLPLILAYARFCFQQGLQGLVSPDQGLGEKGMQRKRVDVGDQNRPEKRFLDPNRLEFAA